MNRKLTCIAVGDINSAFEWTTKKNTNDTLSSVFRNSIVIIYNAKEH